MTIFTIVFLFVFILELALVFLGLGRMLRRRPDGKSTMIWAGCFALIYSIVLVGVGITSHATHLRRGEQKCFDDWCFAVTGSTRTSKGIDIQAVAINRGRGDQAADSPRVLAIVNGKEVTLDCPIIHERIKGNSERQINLHLDAPVTDATKLVVTEGGEPSVLVIGDENSPFHAKSSWDITPLDNGDGGKH